MYRAFYKKAIDSFFEEQFKKSHENLKEIIFQSHVSDLDRKKYSKFSHCYTGLGASCSPKEAITASFVEHFNENQENTICVYLVVIIQMVTRIFYMVKQILLGNMNSYFYVDSIATALAASPNNGVTA